MINFVHITFGSHLFPVLSLHMELLYSMIDVYWHDVHNIIIQTENIAQQSR